MARLQQLLCRICRRVEFALESDAQRHCACGQAAGACAKDAGIERSHEDANGKSAQSSAGRKLRNGGSVARRDQTVGESTDGVEMKFQNLMASTGEWLRGEGPHHQVVVSSRVRLARNLRNRAFPGWAKKAERTMILELIKPRVEELPEMQEPFSELLQDLSALEKQVLVERHLISREHAAKSVGSAIIMNRKQTLSVMVNEEDHLRMQSIRSGLQLRQAFKLVDKVDSALEAKLDFAYDAKLGYLTACPTNVGTGMRASAMLHLPGLVLSELINQVIQAVNKIGLAVRGLYGEGTEAMGNLFQISNQTTLGEKEDEIISRLNKVIETIIEKEQDARLVLIQKKPNTLWDQIRSELINQVIQAVNKIGLAVRGLYGEGTEAMGNLFQISNQTTLGEKEDEIISRLNKVIETIIEKEQDARQVLIQKKPNTLWDQIGRAYGLLTYAHAMTSKEALNLLSVVKLGIDLGAFPEDKRLAIDQLFIETQPAHLQKSTQQKLNAEERDHFRAQIIRERLKSFPKPDISKVAREPEPTGNSEPEKNE